MFTLVNKKYMNRTMFLNLEKGLVEVDIRRVVVCESLCMACKEVI